MTRTRSQRQRRSRSLTPNPAASHDANDTINQAPITSDDNAHISDSSSNVSTVRSRSGENGSNASREPSGSPQSSMTSISTQLKAARDALNRLDRNLTKQSTKLHNLLVNGTPLHTQSQTFLFKLETSVSVCANALTRTEEQFEKYNMQVIYLTEETPDIDYPEMADEQQKFDDRINEAHELLARAQTSIKHLKECLSRPCEKDAGSSANTSLDPQPESVISTRRNTVPEPRMTVPVANETQASTSTTHNCEDNTQSSHVHGDANSVMLNQINRLISLYEQQTPIHTQPPQQFPTNSDRARFPTLGMPKFDGNILNWKPFWDRFEGTVGSSHLSAVEKMVYLMDCMVGEAKEQLQGLSLTTENYEIALQLLKSRYGKQNDLIAAIYRKIDTLPVIPTEPHLLRKHVGCLESQLKTLEGLGENPTGALLVGTLLKKIPKSLLLIMDLTKPEEEDWTVPRLRKSLAAHADRIERTARDGNDEQLEALEFTADALFAQEKSVTYNARTKSKAIVPSIPSYRPNPQRTRTFGQSTPQNRYNLNNAGTSLVTVSCVFCGERHYSNECPKFTTVDARRARIRDRCTICLSRQHQRAQCQSTKPCFHCKKTRNHHTSLCYERYGNMKPEMQAIANDNLSEQNSNDANEPIIEEPPPSVNGEPESGVLAFNECVAMQTARITVCNPKTGQEVETLVLFDSGSTRTYMSETLAKRLKLRLSDSSPIGVNRFASGKCVTVPTKSAVVGLMSQDRENIQIPITIIEKITGNITRRPINMPEVTRKTSMLHMADPIPEKKTTEPLEMLIGNDYWADLVTGERKEVIPGLYLLASRFGWMLSGRLPIVSVNKDLTCVSIASESTGCIQAIAELHKLEYAEIPEEKSPDMTDLFSLEAVGICAKPPMSDDEQALENFEKTIQVRNDRYEITFPFRDGAKSVLPTNYGVAYGRLKTLLRKLTVEPTLLEKYSAIFTDQLQKGVIEKVTENSQTGPIQHYLPHHAVITPQKETTKVRVVYDGSAKVRRDELSLNQSLLRGPVLLEDLCGILLRLRHHAIALISDIEKAFLQVGIQVQDRDITRFLWLDDPELPATADNIATYRFCRVPFGLNCSPFLLAAVMRYHLQKYPVSDCAKAILQNHYVDNSITGVESITEAKSFYNESKVIFREASMNLTQWISNDPEVLRHIPDDDQSKKTTKILGILWNPKTDQMSIAGPNDAKLAIKTKRELLSAIGSVFDPLGLLAPATVKAKLLLQKVTQDKQNWDEPMSESRLQEVNAVVVEIQQISEVKFPRYIGSLNRESKLDLVCFTDASQLSYSAAVYVRVTINGATTSHLVFAKSRLNPIKRITIPRLEMLAILIGTRALRFVEEQLQVPVEQRILCSDSQIALSWILFHEKLDTWTQNRLREIRKAKHLRFRHVSTTENPADLATRGVSAAELSEFWWRGPEWLTKPKQQWPPSIIPEFNVDDAKIEHNAEITLATTETVLKTPFDIDAASFANFAKRTLTRLLRLTAICLCFVANLKGSNSQTCIQIGANGKRYAEISNIGLLEARNEWVRAIQKQTYPDIISRINAKKSHEMQQLGLQINHAGVLVCSGRMTHARISNAAKYPILLPKTGCFSALVLRDCHIRSGHAAPEQMLSTLRHEYWIPAVRPKLAQLKKHCYECNKWQRKSYPQPRMPELPESRVTPQPAFSATGLDFFGPMKVRIAGQISNVWVCLFTCLTIRAVHLELVLNLTTFEFLQAMRRFTSRRGRPARIISDNAPSFKLADEVTDKMWAEVLSDPEVYSYCAQEGIRWTFITEFAPWEGGVYERMVGVVKNPLRKCLGRSMLSFMQFSTLLCEVEAIVNSRPLTYVSQDLNDNAVLTPNHFLMLNPRCGAPTSTEDSSDPDFELFRTTGTEVKKLWKKGLNLLDEFWKQWTTEYLLNMRQRTTYEHKKVKTATLVPKVGHIVWIKDKLTPRGSWRIARIVELLPGRDGVVRSALVKLSKTGRIVGRPVSLLCPLELSDIDSHDAVEVRATTIEDHPTRELPPARPKRVAAVKARDFLKNNQWLLSDDNPFDY